MRDGLRSAGLSVRLRNVRLRSAKLKSIRLLRSARLRSVRLRSARLRQAEGGCQKVGDQVPLQEGLDSFQDWSNQGPHLRDLIGGPTITVLSLTFLNTMRWPSAPSMLSTGFFKLCSTSYRQTEHYIQPCPYSSTWTARVSILVKPP